MTLDQKKFWPQFKKNYWEKEPLLVKNFTSPVKDISEDQIFSMLVKYSDHCRKQKNVDGFKFYIDGQLQYEQETLQILPTQKDKTLQGYNQRMEEIFEDYCLVCDELLQVSEKNSKKLQDFTTTLFKHVGFPNRFVEMGLYLGNYRQTPFGVHVDGCGVFSFPVVGKKTFRLWTPEFARKNPSLDRAHNYSKFKKNSHTMKASTGDMTYWPSTSWHIAESDGSFNATWSLGVWVDLTHQENLESALRPLLKSKLGELGIKTMVQLSKENSSAEALPQNYLETLKAIKNISENEWYDALLKSWLELASKKGFKNFPQTQTSSKVSLKHKIKVNEFSSSILWSNLQSEVKTIYAFQGNLIESKPSPKVIKLITALNLGKICLISDYIQKNDLPIVQTLVKLNAFEIL